MTTHSNQPTWFVTRLPLPLPYFVRGPSPAPLSKPENPLWLIRLYLFVLQKKASFIFCSLLFFFLSCLDCLFSIFKGFYPKSLIIFMSFWVHQMYAVLQLLTKAFHTCHRCLRITRCTVVPFQLKTFSSNRALPSSI